MSAIEDCLRRAMVIHGARSASLVDYTTGFTVGATGDADHQPAAVGTAEILHAVMQAAAHSPAAPGDSVEDVILTTAGAYFLLRPVRTRADSRLALGVWLDRAEGNLAIAHRRTRMLVHDLV